VVARAFVRRKPLARRTRALWKFNGARMEKFAGNGEGRWSSSQRTCAKGASLSCPSSATRGNSITCQINNGPAAGSSYSWQFTDLNNNVVNSTNTNTIWSGVMATSGTVSVSIGGSIPLTPASVIVNSRTNFAFTAQNPAQGHVKYAHLLWGHHQLSSQPARTKLR
jgi:hypothetical protein